MKRAMTIVMLSGALAIAGSIAPVRAAFPRSNGRIAFQSDRLSPGFGI